MTDQLPDTVNYLLLVLLYLFFGRIVWAVWSEVRTPAAPRGWQAFSASETVTSDKSVLSFVIVEPRQHRGARHVLSSTLTVGRDDICDIVVTDDAYISGTHRSTTRWCVAGRPELDQRHVSERKPTVD